VRVEFSERADGQFAVWRFEPDEDRASPWVCIDVVKTVMAALARLRSEKSNEPN